jgi:SulP family sulfate permease
MLDPWFRQQCWQVRTERDDGARGREATTNNRPCPFRSASFAKINPLSAVRGDRQDPNTLSCTLASSVTSESEGEATPTGRRVPLAGNESDGSEENDSSALRGYLAADLEREDVERAAAVTTALLGGERRVRWSERLRQDLRCLGHRASKVTARDIARECIVEPVKTVPSVILGVLLNVLDGVSYGMIL